MKGLEGWSGGTMLSTPHCSEQNSGTGVLIGLRGRLASEATTKQAQLTWVSLLPGRRHPGTVIVSGLYEGPAVLKAHCHLVMSFLMILAKHCLLSLYQIMVGVLKKA